MEDGLTTTTKSDRMHLINLAVQIMFMVDSEAQGRLSDNYTFGGERATQWLGSESLVDFVKKSFPTTTHAHNRGEFPMSESKTMTAGGLQKHLRIGFKGTDNLAEHLL